MSGENGLGLSNPIFISMSRIFDESDLLQIAGVQHFFYCERQWALIHIEDMWAEDGRTAKGRVVHQRVHEPKYSRRQGDVITTTGMMVRSLVHGFYGICDSVEFIPSDIGTELPGRDGFFQVRPVEYKVGKPKRDNLDAVQLCLQCIALEEMIMAEIREAQIFYHETRRRQSVNIDDQLRTESLSLIKRMRSLYDRGETPRPEFGKRCNNCSLSELCMPRMGQGWSSVSEYIDHMASEQTHEKTP